MDILRLERHPLSKAWGDVGREDRAALDASVLEHGILDPITLYEDMVLDGWHRYLAGLAAGFDHETYFPHQELRKGDDPVDFVIAKNAHRRHQTKTQVVAVIVTLRADSLAAQGGDRTQTAKSAVSSKDIAKEAGCSMRLVEEVRKRVREGHGPALIAGSETLDSLRKLRKARRRMAVENEEVRVRTNGAAPSPPTAPPPEREPDPDGDTWDPHAEEELSEVEKLEARIAALEQENLALRIEVDRLPPTPEDYAVMDSRNDELVREVAELRDRVKRQAAVIAKLRATRAA